MGPFPEKSVHVAKEIPVLAVVDVLVVGGGIAGCVSAITAAKAGVRTIVIERYGQLGGNLGPGGIAGAPNLELPRSMAKSGMPGVPGEFVRRCEEEIGGRLFQHYLRDSQVASHVWLSMMLENGVELMLNTFAGDPLMDGSRVVGLEVENKTGAGVVLASTVVDATGDADVAARAGAPIDNGNDLFNPGLAFTIGNVDVQRFESEVLSVDASPVDVGWARDLHPVVDSRIRFLTPLLRFYRKAWESGLYKFLRKVDDRWVILCDHGFFRSMAGWQYVVDPLRTSRFTTIQSMVGVHGPFDDEDRATSGDASLMTALEVNSRLFIYETVSFLRNHMPGYEQSYLHFVAPYFQTRGGRSIVGEYSITVEDAERGVEHDDVVFVADRHRFKYKDKPDWRDVTGDDVFGYEPDQTFDYPFRQMLPRGIDGVLAAGRSSVKQPPVLRTRWMTMMSGIAAGAAAAVAVEMGVVPRAIDVRRLQRCLREQHGVMLGDGSKLTKLGIHPAR